ncbi:GlsB/YeaQ/YmgE family stress response membrane protein [Actinophytocola sp.]|uniref:GlsB/YeaQ/YmgE family stress response membrane protein n=1 Tax=Actinophytocola sp. TaxID=1872138 RepID=UPI00389AD06F
MEITGLITAIVFGAIIGGLGRAIVPGRHNMSLLVTILVGIVAAVAGTGVAELIGVADTSGIDWTEFALQVIFAGGGVSLLSGLRQRSTAE